MKGTDGMNPEKVFLGFVGTVGVFVFALLAIVAFNHRPGEVTAVGGFPIASAICFLALVLLFRK